ncbi:hypothetical protein [Citrobacter sp. Cb026]|uniref:hypothetical protein n=1 Tax=Citrobacter sp. Cb026 TaxID=2985022 RepID=UPI00257E7570|nr:hypothetical protein [Citrobacter sp. Cb026]MDM3424459.1 hypothetical protein [Citrobacter sp. Cb026]
MTRMSTIYSRLSYGTGTTLTGCGVSAKAYAETAKTAKEVSWMLADRIAGLSLSDWAIIVGIACTCHERCNSDPHPTPEIRSRG